MKTGIFIKENNIGTKPELKKLLVETHNWSDKKSKVFNYAKQNRDKWDSKDGILLEQKMCKLQAEIKVKPYDLRYQINYLRKYFQDIWMNKPHFSCQLSVAIGQFRTEYEKYVNRIT